MLNRRDRRRAVADPAENPPLRTPEEERQAILDAIPYSTLPLGRPRLELPDHIRETIEELLAQGVSYRRISLCLANVYPVGRSTIRNMIDDGRLQVRRAAGAASTRDL